MQRILVLLLAVACLHGCVVYANVPAQSGDAAINNANARDVRKAMAAALIYLAQDRPIESDFAFVLPQGTQAETYEQVAAIVGTNAMPGDVPANQALPTVDVRQVRVRPTPISAEVDIIRPSVGWDMTAPKQLVTVHLRWDLFSGWYPDRALRVWKMPIDDALDVSAGNVPQ